MSLPEDMRAKRPKRHSLMICSHSGTGSAVTALSCPGWAADTGPAQLQGPGE